jgi:hypothetical protein
LAYFIGGDLGQRPFGCAAGTAVRHGEASLATRRSRSGQSASGARSSRRRRVGAAGLPQPSPVSASGRALSDALYASRRNGNCISGRGMDMSKPAAREEHQSIDWPSYLRFGAMIATSTAVMYALTYTNVFAFAHIRWSEERLYMAVTMGAAMAIVMLLFMRKMHHSRVVNIGILVGALVVGGAAFGLSQSQGLVDDVAYMDGMIPHHSIAILTSRRANIRDVRVRKLADGIIEAQVREIAEMERLIADIKANGPVTASDDRVLASLTPR